MTVRTFAFAALAGISAITPAAAEERIDLTPPLYREQAHPTATVRRSSEMTTTPSLVRVSGEPARRIAEASAR